MAAPPPPPSADEAAKMPVAASAAPPLPSIEEAQALKVGEAHGGPPDPTSAVSHVKALAGRVGGEIADAARAAETSPTGAGDPALAVGESLVRGGMSLGQTAYSGLKGIAAGVSDLASGSPLSAAVKTAADTIDEQNQRNQQTMDAVPESAGAKLADVIQGVPTEVGAEAGDYAYDKTGSPLAGAAADVAATAAGFIVPGAIGHKVGVARAASAAAREAALRTTAAGDAVGVAARSVGMSPELSTALAEHAKGHVTESGHTTPEAHAAGAVDRMPDEALKNLSTRYKGLRDSGLTEPEVKAVLKQSLVESAKKLAPKVKPAPDAADKGAAAIQDAFGTGDEPAAGDAQEGSAEAPVKPFGEDLAKQRASLMPGPTEVETSQLEALKTQIDAEENPHVKGVLNKQRKGIEAEITKRNGAIRLHQMAIEALRKGDRASHDLYMGEADKLSPPAATTEGIKVGTPEETAAADVPHTLDDPNATPEVVSTSGIEVGEPEAEQITAESQKALPPPAAIPVTPEGQAVAPPVARTADTGQVQREAAAGAKHPGAPDPTIGPPPDGFDVSKSVGLGGGKSRSGKVGYISRMIPQFLDVKNRKGQTVRIPVHEEIAAHENAEHPNIEAKGYDKAHNADGNAATAKFLAPYDVDPRAYSNALRPHMRAAELDALQHPENVPKDLDSRPYAKPTSEVDRTHQLPEDHPHNRLNKGAAKVAARKAAREAALKEHADADQHAAEPVAERPVQGNNPDAPVQPAEPSAKEKTQGGDSGASPKVGEGNEEPKTAESPGNADDRRDGGRAPAAKANPAEEARASTGDSGAAPDVADEGTTDRVPPGEGADAGEVPPRSAENPDGEREQALAAGDAAGDGEGADQGSRGAREEGDRQPLKQAGDSASPTDSVNRDARDIRKSLGKKFGEAGIRFMEKTGLLNIVHSSEVPEHLQHLVAEGARAIYDPTTQKGYLLTDRIPEGEEASALAHEIGAHHGIPEWLGKGGEVQLLTDLRNMRRAGQSAVAEAWRKTQADYPELDENSHNFMREVAARLVEDAPHTGPIRRLIDRIKSWLYKNGLRRGFDEGTVRGIAMDALRKSMRDPGPTVLKRETLEAGEPNEAALDPAQNTPLAAKGGLVVPPKDARDITWNMFRERQALVARYIETSDAKIHTARTTIDKLIGQDYKKVQDAYHSYETTGQTPATFSHKGIDGGKPFTLQPIFDALKKSNDEIYKAVKAIGREVGYIENYLAHTYKKPGEAESFFKEFFQKNPLYKTSFTKERYYDTLRAAEKAGLEPLSKNIIDMQMARWAQMKRFQQMHAFSEDMAARGWIMKDPGTFETPHGWAKVNDPLFHGKLVPEEVANDLNNYLNPGPGQNWLWKTYRHIQGGMTSLNLGLSAFHPMATTSDVVNQRITSVWTRALLRGDFAGAAKDAIRIPGDALGAFSAAVGKGEGAQLGKVWRGQIQGDPVQQMIIRHTEMGGGRNQMMPTTDGTSWTQLGRAINQRDALGVAKQSARALIENTGPIIHHMIVPAQKWVAKSILVRSTLDGFAKQLGVQPGDYAAIEKLMHPDAQRQIMAKVMDQVDDRLGQFNYANRRINKTMLTAQQALLRSPGWFRGGVSTMLGPIWDIKRWSPISGKIGPVEFGPEKIQGPLDKAGKINDAHFGRFTNRQAFFVTMMSTYAMMNGGINSIIGDFNPDHGGVKDWRDLFSIRFPDGHRFIPASYAKEFFELIRAPVHRVTSALSPVISAAGEAVGAAQALAGDDSKLNRDYFGNKNVDPDAHIGEQLHQVVQWMAKQVTPFAISGSHQNAGRSTIEKALPYLGAPAAPAAISDSRLDAFVKNRFDNQRAAGNLNPSDVEDHARLSDAVKEYRANPNTDLSTFNFKDREKIKQRAKDQPLTYPLSQLTLRQQLDAYDKASPEERDKYKMRQLIQGHVMQKRGRDEIKNIEKVSPEDAEELRQRVRALREAAPA